MRHALRHLHKSLGVGPQWMRRASFLQNSMHCAANISQCSDATHEVSTVKQAEGLRTKSRFRSTWKASSTGASKGKQPVGSNAFIGQHRDDHSGLRLTGLDINTKTGHCLQTVDPCNASQWKMQIHTEPESAGLEPATCFVKTGKCRIENASL